jgi:hypothetical protein
MGHYKRGPAGVIWGTTRGVPREWYAAHKLQYFHTAFTDIFA